MHRQLLNPSFNLLNSTFILTRSNSLITACLYPLSTTLLSLQRNAFFGTIPSRISESFAGISEEIHNKRVVNRALVLDGNSCSALWLRELQPRIKRITDSLNRSPKLSVFLVGDREDSYLYVRRKTEICNQSGIDVTVRHLPASITQDVLESAIQAENDNHTIDGILIQLPLPIHLDEESVTRTLDSWKDVDGLHPLNVGQLLMRGHSPRFIPCAALGCMQLLKLNRIPVQGKTVVIVGDSNIVGVPLSVLLRNENAAIVSVCHGISYREQFEHPEVVQKTRVKADACCPTLPGPRAKWVAESSQVFDSLCPIALNPDLPNITKTADVLIVAVGCPKMVKKDWVKPGAIVLDVGINVVSKPQSNSRQKFYQIAGDVDFQAVAEVASAISPVPGGIGPMTIAGVVHNTVQAAEYSLCKSQNQV